MRYFDGKSLEEARQTFRQLLMQHHPDRHPDAEKEEHSRIFKEIQEQFQSYLRSMPADAFVKDFHKTAGTQARAQQAQTGFSPEFYEAYEAAMRLNIEVEVIGGWIHATQCTWRDGVALQQNGYWWSVQHKAYVWNPAGKKNFKPVYTTDILRARFGSEKKRDKRYMG